MSDYTLALSLAWQIAAGETAAAGHQYISPFAASGGG